MRTCLYLAIACFALCYLCLASASPLTCNSGVKLTHVDTSFHLTSSEVNWGSGSGQQSVTATSSPSDPSSLWMVVGKHPTGELSDSGIEGCAAGENFKCNDIVRFTHLLTGKNLHSHLFRSPLSGQQEVSAFGENGIGDNSDDWKIVCGGGKDLAIDVPFHLMHVATGKYLTSNADARFNNQNCPNCPILGQLEVVAVKSVRQAGLWVIQRGVFIHQE